jgi:hypothetical protein
MSIGSTAILLRPTTTANPGMPSSTARSTAWAVRALSASSAPGTITAISSPRSELSAPGAAPRAPRPTIVTARACQSPSAGTSG